LKRFYIFGAVLFLIGAGAALYGILANRVSIPGANITELDLEGKLVLAHEAEGVSILDLATGHTEMIFTPEPKGLLTGATLSPDGQTLVAAYSPPPEGLVQFGFTSLYKVSIGGSSAPEVIVDSQQRAVAARPVFSADGETLFYEYTRTSDDALRIIRSIEHIRLPDGDPQTLVENGYSFALSADGTQLAYITTEEGSKFDNLFVAAQDGEGAISLADSEIFLGIDSPAFSPDGGTIVFSGQEKQKLFASEDVDLLARGFDTLFGVKSASAHSEEAADIWRVSTGGGEPQKLATLLAQGIVLGYAPDGEHIAFVTTQGLYIMQADGNGLVRLQDVSGLRSVQWIP